MKQLKPLLLNFGLICGSLAFGIIVGEIGLRVAGIQYPPPPDPDSETLAYTARDPYRGWAPRPNAATVWTGEGKVSELKMNSVGMRDKERTEAKPSNSYRVAFLGDSFIEALHVPLEKTAVSIMEKELSQCSALKGKTVEVLNFGVQGYGTAQELMTWRHHASKFSPDLVILGVYPGNDVRNNYRPLEHDHLRPYFVEENNQLVEDLSFRRLDPNSPERDRYGFSQLDRLPYDLINQSRILQLIRKAELDSKRRQLEKDFAQININFYKEPPDQNWQQAWNITEKLITKVRDEVTAKKVDFMVTAVTDSFQVHPQPEKRQEFMQYYNIKDLYYPDKRIQALGERENFTVFRLAEPLRTEAEKTGECVHGFENAVACGGHWNVKGNKIVGELMADQVCQRVTNQAKKP